MTRVEQRPRPPKAPNPHEKFWGFKPMATDYIDYGVRKAYFDANQHESVFDRMAARYRIGSSHGAWTRFENRDGSLTPVHRDPEVQNRRDRVAGWISTTGTILDVFSSDAKKGKMRAALRSIRQTRERNKKLKETGKYVSQDMLTVKSVWGKPVFDRASFHDWTAIAKPARDEAETLPTLPEPTSGLKNGKQHAKPDVPNPNIPPPEPPKGGETKERSNVFTLFDKTKAGLGNVVDAVKTTRAISNETLQEKQKRKRAQQGTRTPLPVIHPILGTPLGPQAPEQNGHAPVAPSAPEATSVSTPQVDAPANGNGHIPDAIETKYFGTPEDQATADILNYAPAQETADTNGDNLGTLVHIPHGMTQDEANWLISHGYISDDGKVYRPSKFQEELYARYGIEDAYEPEPTHEPPEEKSKPIIIDMVDE